MMPPRALIVVPDGEAGAGVGECTWRLARRSALEDDGCVQPRDASNSSSTGVGLEDTVVGIDNK